MRCCALFSTDSGSITSSCPRPIATRRAASTRLSARCSAPSGPFDEVTHRVPRAGAAIRGLMLPPPGEHRRKTYSPLLPISPTSGRVLQVPVEVIDAEAGLVAFDDEDGTRVRQSAF